MGGIRGNEGEGVSTDGVIKIGGGRGLGKRHIDVEDAGDDNGGVREVICEAVEEMNWVCWVIGTQSANIDVAGVEGSRDDRTRLKGARTSRRHGAQRQGG